MAAFGRRNPNSDLVTAVLFDAPLLCPHNVFQDARVKLVGGLAALADMEALSRSALVLACDNCSYLLWFGEHDAVELYEVGPDYER